MNFNMESLNNLYSLNLSKGKLLLGISVKNRLFDKALITNFIELIKTNNSNALIVIFDFPYAYNDAAERESEIPTFSEFKRILDIGNQKERMIQKLLFTHSARSISLKRWSDFRNQKEFIIMRNEFIQASQNIKFRQLLINQIKLINCFKNQYFINFQIHEIPMLIYIYYILGYNIDIYPGENFEIFKLIENGNLVEILPFTSKIVMSKQPLLFINCSCEKELLPPTFCISNGRENASYQVLQLVQTA